GGADYPSQFYATDCSELQRLHTGRIAVAIKQLGTLDGESDFLAAVTRAQIGGTSDRCLGRAVTVVHHSQDQAFGIRVRFYVDGLAHTQFVPLPVGSDLFDVGYFQAGHEQPVDDVFKGKGELHKILQPAQRHTHGSEFENDRYTILEVSIGKK